MSDEDVEFVVVEPSKAGTTALRELVARLRRAGPPMVTVRCGADLGGGKRCREEMAIIVPREPGGTVGQSHVRVFECPKVRRHLDPSLDLWPPAASEIQAAWREVVEHHTLRNLWCEAR